jgi:hypothetical protein
MQARPPVVLERLRRRVLGPLFDRLGYDLVPAAPDWTHRPTSPREVLLLLDSAADILERDLAAAGIVPDEPVRKTVREFWELIPSAPVRQRRGGSGFNGALQLYVAMRALKPRFVIESGVFRGLTTWVIRHACPQVEKIFCHDPDLSGLQYRDAGAAYSRGDWSRAEWSGIDPARTVAFFDDHVAQGRRVVEAHARGLTRLLFDDDAAGHRIHAHGGPAHPTIAMITGPEHSPEPIRWTRNGRAFEQPADDALVREAAGRIARAHAFDDLHRATGYSPARLTYVELHRSGPDRS